MTLSHPFGFSLALIMVGAGSRGSVTEEKRWQLTQGSTYGIGRGLNGV